METAEAASRDAAAGAWAPRRRPWVDPWSSALVVTMLGLLAAAWVGHGTGALPWWVALGAATLAMNLSFTAWHEPAHGSFSRSRAVNTLVGWITSFASVYPGYFARRREHLAHHKYEGQAGLDPVYPRIQRGPVGLVGALVAAALGRPGAEIPAAFLRRTVPQRVSDAASNLLAAAVVAVAVLLGHGGTALLAWVLPRGLILVVHAFYVCLLAHGVPGGGYQVLRVRRDRWLWRVATVNQHLHGVHHRWPSIPWHAYPDVARRAGPALRALGFEGPRERASPPGGGAR